MPSELLQQLVHSNWKERIAACEALDKVGLLFREDSL